MSDWKSILSSIAPVAATALGGPLAGAAVKFLGSSLLGDENAGEKELEKFVLGANPDQLAMIKSVDNDFKIKMEQLSVDVKRLDVDNTKSARLMAENTSMWPQVVLSALFVIGYFVVLISLALGLLAIPDNVKDVVVLLLGIMTRELPTIMQFWFGSSFGSKKKTDKMENK